jgi:hypothetical protein
MPQYSGPHHPQVAAYAFGGLPGNYVLYDRWGRAYPGRQARGVNRIGTHLRDFPGEFVEAHFMVDGYDDPCVRASRERTAARNLIANKVKLRNKRWPDVPGNCRSR